MFKVSFKETQDNFSKIVEKMGKTTTVTLRGTVKLPAFWHALPKEISNWITGRTKVECYENMADNTLIIFSSGKARYMEEDKYDTILGERLAEARAKYDIYKFFYDLTYKLYDYYSKIMFGKAGIVSSGQGDCLSQDVKKYEALCIRESHHIGELLASNSNGE